MKYEQPTQSIISDIIMDGFRINMGYDLENSDHIVINRVQELGPLDHVFHGRCDLGDERYGFRVRDTIGANIVLEWNFLENTI